MNIHSMKNNTLMFEHKLMLLKPEDGFYHYTTITFNSKDELLKDAAFAVISTRPEYHDCFLIDPDTLSPMTFDSTVFIKGGNYDKTNKPYPSDYFGCTFNEFKALTTIFRENVYFHSFGNKSFCRIHRSNGGKAGEFFMTHNAHFRKCRVDTLDRLKDLQEKRPLRLDDFKTAFHPNCYLNSPEHYFTY